MAYSDQGNAECTNTIAPYQTIGRGPRNSTGSGKVYCHIQRASVTQFLIQKNHLVTPGEVRLTRHKRILRCTDSHWVQELATVPGIVGARRVWGAAQSHAAYCREETRNTPPDSVPTKAPSVLVP